MSTVLHILLRPEDELAQRLVRSQQQAGDAAIEVVDLTQPNPDYDALLEKIFAANSIAVW